MTRQQTADYLLDTGYSASEADYESICLTGIDLDTDEEEESEAVKWHV